MTKRSRSEAVAEVERLGVVAIIRMPDPAALRAVVDALAEGGVRALEVTMTVPRAIELIAEIAPTLPRDFIFGAGTVLDAETVRRAVVAGAQFIVSPVFKPDVVKAAHAAFGKRVHDGPQRGRIGHADDGNHTEAFDLGNDFRSRSYCHKRGIDSPPSTLNTVPVA